MMPVWLAGLLRRQWPRLVAAGIGVGVAVALLGCLGSFLAASQATMTARAAQGVAVDWQVQLTPTADPATVDAVLAATAAVSGSAPVGYATTSGLSTRTGASTQTTGPGVILGIPADYRHLFPGQIRTLAGADTGVLLAQQSAANLHATPGDTVMIGRAGLAPVPVRVTGIVELPQANSLFQTVGAPPSAQPAAPPDNVVLMPDTDWHHAFDPLAATRPDLVSSQIHVRLDHTLPPSPAAAYSTVAAAAHNLEARAAGAAQVGDNLGAALDAARGDAAYAQVLFLFLGLPGAALAVLLTATITGAGADRRRGEQALLRVRGATSGQLLGLAAVEAAVVGVIGAVLGVLAATLISTIAFGPPLSWAGAAVGWAGAAAAAVVGAGATVLIPAWRDQRARTVAAGRAQLSTARMPWWARLGVDGVVALAAVLVFLATTGGGYRLVLAPEGVSAIAVSYWALAAPALGWLAAALLTWRVADLLLGPGRAVVAALLRPATGPLAATIAAAMSRQRRPLVRAIVVLALAIAFAASTATFNATYRQQAEVDAQLTNGADVAVTAAPGLPLPADTAATLAGVSGVRAVQAMQHRFAYIGADLQDLYGVDPATITQATAVQDSYFPGSTARAVMATLAAHPDSLLVSAETVTDFQLKTGDPITLRLIDAATHQPRPVIFHYAGIVTEFPTAPKDSFFVANAAYLAAQTGSSAPGEFLVDTGGRDTAAVTARVRALLGATATVTDIATVRAAVGSSLTAVDLAGLTRIELVFALVLAVGAGALVLGLGLAERRRTFALWTALGATGTQLRAIIFSETAILTATGTLTGAAAGGVLSVMLVKVLNGVFDPPPEAMAVPWRYLIVVAALTIGALAAVSAAAVTVLARRAALTTLRDL